VPVTFTGRARRDLGTSKAAAGNTAARRLVAMRLTAASEYPAMEEMRDRAREIRLHTLAHLDRYLENFADSVERVGGHVFFADGADEAQNYVRRLAADRKAHLIVKSKSMVTEEIELNEALEADGRQVVESDLGEFIVQLSEDRPSHIIAPVLHKTRQEIGRLFADRLDVPYTDDPTELNEIARRHLRRIFLSADMGVSGVNFGVASTGSICTVTNEGNGRLTTTAPRIHVAVMGMERIVPTPEDLAVMLEVLARSATGQRLSVYTSVVTGSRRPDDPDGPDEFHVVIVDNGRSEILASSAAEILACIRCGACLNVCPVYREVGGHAYGSVYSGPVGAVLTPALLGHEGWADLPYASTLCGACVEACPVRIDIPRMLLELRGEIAATDGPFRWLEPGLAAYTYAATHPRAWRAFLASGGLLGRIAGREGWIRRLPTHGWTASRDLPAPARESFHAWWRRHRREPHGT
jgi:L-lactate dehydrogenase complex protein LldF